jgi:hypothetical protein
MAFDKIFQGSPSTAPPTTASPQSPQLGIDTVNDNLYINSGNGWIEIPNESNLPVGGITQLTGDVTAGPGSGSKATTLATVNTNVGTFNMSNTTVNGKGLVTAITAGTFPATTGAPVTTPAAGTPAFDSAASKLWVYNGTAWVGTVLS